MIQQETQVHDFSATVQLSLMQFAVVCLDLNHTISDLRHDDHSGRQICRLTLAQSVRPISPVTTAINSNSTPAPIILCAPDPSIPTDCLVPPL
jgi:hypothetical protein